jgi:Flp pilus assembly pilin Flp
MRQAYVYSRTLAEHFVQSSVTLRNTKLSRGAGLLEYALLALVAIGVFGLINAFLFTDNGGFITTLTDQIKGMFNDNSVPKK